MKKRIVCMAVCLTMLITAGCGNSTETDVSRAQELSTAEGSGEKSEEKPEGAAGDQSDETGNAYQNVKSVTMNIGGSDLVFPTSREDAEKFLNDNGYELRQNDRVQISGFSKEQDGFLILDYLDQDPSICTGIQVQGIPVTCGDLVTEDQNTYKSVYDLCNDNSSDYHPIYQREGTTDYELGIQQNSADNCYLISFKDTVDNFWAFINRDYYDNHGGINRSLDIYEGEYLSSTDIEGLYLCTQDEGKVPHTHYFYREGLNFKMDKASVCTVDTYDRNYSQNIENFDNIYAVKNDNGEIIEIYEAGVSSAASSEAKAKYEELCRNNNISVEPKEFLDELVPELWHHIIIECLGWVMSQNPDMKGGTFRINKESVKMDYDVDTTYCDFKMTIDEYPDVMLLVDTTFDYETRFSIGVKAANVIPGKQIWASCSNDAVGIMDQPSDIGKEFDDFFSTSGKYEDLPTTYSIHDYVGYFASGISGTTNMLIEDASGNPVAVYLGEHDYSRYHKVPIIEYGDDVNFPGSNMLDGLDFSHGEDADGNILYIE